MAYVRPYQSQQEPSAIPSTPGAPLLDSESRNLADLSGVLGQTADVLYKDETQRAVMSAHGQLSQAMVDINDYQNKLKLSWAADGTDPTGFTPVIHKMVDDYGTKLVNQQTNRQARAYVSEAFARMGMHQVEQADNWERQQIERYQVGQLDKQGDDYAKGVAGDPTQYDLNKQIYSDAVANAKLTPDMREKMLDHGIKKFQAAANQAYIGNKPADAFRDYSKALGIHDETPTLPPGAPAVNSGPVADAVGPIDLNRPAIQNADGTFSTERTITVESDGKHYLVPTIVDGKQRSNDEAIALWRGGKNASVGTFDTNAQAEAAAVARSQEIGRQRGPDAWAQIEARRAADTAPASSGPTTEQFIAKQEGISLTAYDDAGGKSIGRGHSITPAERAQGYIQIGNERAPLGKLTPAQADALYAQDIAKHADVAHRALGNEAWDKLTPNQRTAVVDYAYNVGSVPAGLGAAVLAGDTAGAASLLERGVATSQGKPNAVLDRRRAEEAALFRGDGAQVATGGAAPAPMQLASSGEIATDTGPPAPATVLPLDPMHSSTGTKTGISFIDELSTQQLVALRNEAHARMLNGQAGARAELTRQMQNAEAATKNGETPAEIPDSLFDAAHPGDKVTADAYRAQFKAWKDFGTDLKTVRPMPDADIAKYVAGIKAGLPDPSAPDYATRVQRLNATLSAAQHIVKDRQEDPVAALDKQGVYPITPLLAVINDPAKFEAELTRRMQSSMSAQGVYMRQPAVLTNQDAKDIGAIISKAPFATQMQMLASMRRALPDKDNNATFMATMQKIAPDAPEVAVAGVIGAFQPGYQLAPGFAPAQSVAADILQGKSLIDPSKEQNATDGKSRVLVMPDEGKLRQLFVNAVGDTYADHPEAMKTDYQIYRYLYAAAAAKAGTAVGPDNKEPNTDVATQALNAATGGLMDVGHEHKIAKPYGMPDSVFRERFANEYDYQLRQAGLDPAQYPLSNFPAINENSNTYHLRSGSTYLKSKTTGEPILIVVPTGITAVDSQVRPPPPAPVNYLKPGEGASGRRY